ncbi:MAG TPA: hypothetical protein DD789_04700 [Firmicutes bacterium]|jgi:uncharacterized protein YgbK (DUF1537 family)|nr:hypothetical protein [Bacillota bacterium]
MAIWIIADDFTGANDSVVRFAATGAKALTIVSPRFIKEGLNSYQAIAVNTNSRGMSWDDAYQENYKVIQNLPLQSGDLVYKKIDSALRGNIGVELDGLLDYVGGGTIALVAPAFPENGRITTGGYQFLNGILVQESEMARDPVTPVKESHLPTLLTNTSRYKVGYLPLKIVCGGCQEVEAKLNKLCVEGCRIVVADATTNEHLKTLAESCLCSTVKIVPCGTAGLAGALAERIFSPSQGRAVIPPKGKVVGIIGSRSRIAKLQIQQAIKNLPWLTDVQVQRVALASSKQRREEISAVGERVKQALSAGKEGVIVRLDDNPAVEPGLISATALADGLGAIARFVVSITNIKKLYVSGGDTAAAAMDALDSYGLEIKNELESGICLGNLWGGKYAGLMFVTKAGSFGDEKTLVRTLSWINHDSLIIGN